MTWFQQLVCIFLILNGGWGFTLSACNQQKRTGALRLAQRGIFDELRSNVFVKGGVINSIGKKNAAELNAGGVSTLLDRSTVADVLQTPVEDPFFFAKEVEGTDNGHLEDVRVKVASVCVAIFGVAAVGALILLVKLQTLMTFPESVIGYFAVLCAVLLFGSCGVPMKTPSLATANVDPMVVQLYASFGMAAASIPMLLTLIARGTFHMAPWAMVGAIGVRIVSAFTFLAIQKLGYTTAPAIWAGVGMCSSFFWGTGAFNEHISSPTTALSALLFLVVGVVGVATSQSLNEPGMEAKDKDDDLVTLYNPTNTQPVKSMLPVAGIVSCVLAGFADGSQLVPFKLHQVGFAALPGLDQTLNYLCTLGLSSILTTPLLFAAYAAFIKKSIPRLEVEAALLPSFISGILWGPGSILALFASKYLGMAVGFPLTQTCICVTALWGILFFKEIDPSSDKKFARQFPASLAAIITGAFLLARSR